MTHLDTVRQAPIDIDSVTRAFERGPQRHLTLPAGRIAHWSFGQGPDLLCVHGWPLSGATFRGLVPILSTEFTVHVIDLPGTGFTDYDGPVGFEQHGETVRRVIDALALDELALLGHDSGGLIARLAARDDDRVRGMVFGNTEVHGHHSPIVGALAAIARLPGGIAAIGATMRIGAIRRSGLGFGGCFHDSALIEGEFGRLFIEPLLRDPIVARSQWGLLLHADFSINDRIDAIHARLLAPVRCIWGKDDPFFPLAKARRMVASLPAGSDLIEIPNAKLFVHEEHPHTFAMHAKSFLRGLAWRRVAA